MVQKEKKGQKQSAASISLTAGRSFSSRFGLLIVVCSIFVMGLVMIFNTTSAEILDLSLEKSTLQSLLRQMGYALCGLLMASVAYQMGYHRWLQWSPQLLLLFSFLLVLCLIPGIGREVNGSRRWLSFLGLSFQPSEFVKILVPSYAIVYFLRHGGESFTFKAFLKLIGLVSIPMGLILIEPNNGTCGVIMVVLLAFFLLARIRFTFWALPLVIFMGIASISVTQLPYVKSRLRVYWNPELDLKGKGHQPYQAKIAAGSGQFLGKGPGNSLQKFSYLPEAQNDYIAAIYAEEFGFLGILILITLYMSLTFFGLTIAYYAIDFEGFYLAGCIVFLIGFQAFMNLGVVSGLLPSTGLNLPFFSQGGTSLMANIVELGLLFNIRNVSWSNQVIL